MEIKLTNLTKKYDDFIAVDNINLTIGNEIFALLGVNGAGKTTTIKMMTGLTDITEGEIFYNTLSVKKDLNKLKEFINISPQESAIADNLTVKENILFISEIYGIEKQQAVEKTKEIISLFELNSVENKKAKNLSGGMKRRLSIAMALVTKPKVLFLDEPTLGLDVIARSQLWELIKNLKKDITIVLTTHYMEEAEQLADKVAIINNGKVIESGTPEELKNKHNENSLEKAFIKIVKGEM